MAATRLTSQSTSRGGALVALLVITALAIVGLLALQAAGPVAFSHRGHHDSVGSLPGRSARIPRDLLYSHHAKTGHTDEALSADGIVQAALEGHCVDVHLLCAEKTKVYTCIYTPKPWLVGVLIVDEVAGVVITGFGTSPRYVYRQIDKGRWHGCY